MTRSLMLRVLKVVSTPHIPNSWMLSFAKRISTTLMAFSWSQRCPFHRLLQSARFDGTDGAERLLQNSGLLELQMCSIAPAFAVNTTKPLTLYTNGLPTIIKLLRLQPNEKLLPLRDTIMQPRTVDLYNSSSDITEGFQTMSTALTERCQCAYCTKSNYELFWIVWIL